MSQTQRGAPAGSLAQMLNKCSWLRLNDQSVALVSRQVSREPAIAFGDPNLCIFRQPDGARYKWAVTALPGATFL